MLNLLRQEEEEQILKLKIPKKLEILPGLKNLYKGSKEKKFIKVLEGTRVWGFVAIGDGYHKNIPYNRGDTFKAASWNAPAKWARGNVFHQNTDWYEWTGPNYL